MPRQYYSPIFKCWNKSQKLANKGERETLPSAPPLQPIRMCCIGSAKKWLEVTNRDKNQTRDVPKKLGMFALLEYLLLMLLLFMSKEFSTTTPALLYVDGVLCRPGLIIIYLFWNSSAFHVSMYQNTLSHTHPLACVSSPIWCNAKVLCYSILIT